MPKLACRSRARSRGTPRSKAHRRAVLQALRRKLGGGLTTDGEVLVLPEALIEFTRTEEGSWVLWVEARLQAKPCRTGVIASELGFPRELLATYATMITQIIGRGSSARRP